MRTPLLITVLLAGGIANASPGPVAEPQDRPRQREQSKTFARQVHYLAGQVAEFYVKPVASEDLHVAALTGLYQAARKPVPGDLRAQVRQAANLATAIREKS